MNVMSFMALRHTSAAALSALSILGVAPFARADIKDFEFQLTTKTVNMGDAIVAVRLIHKPDGKAVSDAVIFAKRLDMAPEGMETMTTTIEPAPSVEPGVYRFRVDLSMEGAWRLSLAAKVQGEIGAVENRLILKASP